jgi:hypothetical protein
MHTVFLIIIFPFFLSTIGIAKKYRLPIPSFFLIAQISSWLFLPQASPADVHYGRRANPTKYSVGFALFRGACNRSREDRQRRES